MSRIEATLSPTRELPRLLIPSEIALKISAGWHPLAGLRVKGFIGNWYIENKNKIGRKNEFISILCYTMHPQ